MSILFEDALRYQLTCIILGSLQTGKLLTGGVCWWSFRGDVAAAWSSEPLNALECEPDRSSLELSVRDELRPESDRSVSAYSAAATMEWADVGKEADDVDDKDCWSFDGNDDAGLVAPAFAVEGVITIAGYCCCFCCR